MGGQPFSNISIMVGGTEVMDYALFAETSFESSAYAAVGTCTITLRDHDKVLSFSPGQYIRLTIDGVRQWYGILMTIDYGYMFPNVRERKIVLHGSDLNILLDKYYLYNRAHPNRALYNDQPYPINTQDQTVLLYHLTHDCDLDQINNPDINYIDGIYQVDVVNPDGSQGNPVMPGATLRALFEDISSAVSPYQPGSVIFYWGPDGVLRYMRQDTLQGPSVADDPGTGDITCRNLSLTTDISHIKNHVLAFTNQFSWASIVPNKPLFEYVNNSLSASVATYGRWQYAVLDNSLNNVTALRQYTLKVLYQEGTPSERVEFETFTPGLLPGQIITVTSTEFGKDWNVPVRQLSISFPSHNIALYHVSCSFDTQDPWGLLMALKRPTTRGMIPPKFMAIDLDTFNYPDTPAPPASPYTFVRQTKFKWLGSKKIQLAYAYIRFSVIVYDNGYVKQYWTAFNEDDPDRGYISFLEAPTDGGAHLEIQYHVAANLSPS